MKLSATQRGVLDVLATLPTANQRLVRWPGGFWTHPQAREVRPGVPDWSIGVQTVRSMERAGLLVRAGEHPEEWRDPRVLARG